MSKEAGSVPEDGAHCCPLAYTSAHVHICARTHAHTIFKKGSKIKVVKEEF